jgi:hypothetical protein
MNVDFDRLRDDATGWSAFEAETAAWDTASHDVGASQRPEPV